MTVTESRCAELDGSSIHESLDRIIVDGISVLGGNILGDCNVEAVLYSPNVINEAPDATIPTPATCLRDAIVRDTAAAPRRSTRVGGGQRVRAQVGRGGVTAVAAVSYIVFACRSNLRAELLRYTRSSFLLLLLLLSLLHPRTCCRLLPHTSCTLYISR